MDFEKSYDFVSESFLEYMLVRFGFNERWRVWIIACVFSGNLFVVVNGCLIEEVSIQKGPKQGDLLAPFLFLLVVEGFNASMRKAVSIGAFLGSKVGSGGLEVSNLQ